MNKASLLKSIKHLVLSTSLVGGIFLGGTVQATIVQFETNLGNFEVNLYDEGTPLTVANFLNYITTGAYTNSVFHRSVSNFIIQGGGYAYEDQWPLSDITTNTAVINEPVYSNVRGTISMAKRANLPNSATSQWFFNLANNGAGGAQLDVANGGYTVFGEVTGDGMAVIEQIATLPTNHGLDSPFSEIPLQNYTAGDVIDETHLIITNITIIDSATDTAANLSPPLNPGASDNDSDASSGGGSFGGIFFALLASLYFIRKK